MLHFSSHLAFLLSGIRDFRVYLRVHLFTPRQIHTLGGCSCAEVILYVKRNIPPATNAIRSVISCGPHRAMLFIADWTVRDFSFLPSRLRIFKLSVGLQTCVCVCTELTNGRACRGGIKSLLGFSSPKIDSVIWDSF